MEFIEDEDTRSTFASSNASNHQEMTVVAVVAEEPVKFNHKLLQQSIILDYCLSN